MNRRAAQIGHTLLLTLACYSAFAQVSNSERRSQVLRQIATLQGSAFQAFQAADQPQAEASLSRILQLAEENNLGADPSLRGPLNLLTTIPKSAGKAVLVERALRLRGLDPAQLQARVLCSELLGTFVTASGGTFPPKEQVVEYSDRFPVCREMFAKIQAVSQIRDAVKTPTATTAQTLPAGPVDYSRVLPLMKRRWDEARKDHRQPQGISARGIALLSLLSGDDAGARPYILEMQEDLASFNATKNLSLPALPELEQAESRESDPGLSALSLAAFYHLSLHPGDEELKHNALQLLLSGKSREIDDARDTLQILSDPSNTRQPQLLSRLRTEYEANSKEWAALWLNENPGSDSRGKEEAAIRKLQALQTDLHSLVDEYSKTFGRRQSPTVAALQASLGKDDALIEFAQVWWPDLHQLAKAGLNLNPTAADTHYIAYVFRHDKTMGVDLGPAISINDSIHDYRRSMYKDPQALKEPDDDWRAPAHTLYATLWKPLLTALPATQGTQGHIYIAPDGDLARLPFDGVLDDTGRFLIQSWTISYLASGRELLSPRSEQAQTEPSQGKTIVFANPALPVSLPAIPQTAREASTIAATLPRVTVYEGEKANREKLKSISDPLILHLATHGRFQPFKEGTSPTVPFEELIKMKKYGYLRSLIYLSNGPPRESPTRENIVTSLEIALLPLRRTSLVVVSACDSGVGSETPGSSLTGLRSAFRMAGAKASISSLWSEDDDAGQQLMASFYKRLWNSGTPATSSINSVLRQAKLQTMARFPHPYYWAFFVFDGQDQILRF